MGKNLELVPGSMGKNLVLVPGSMGKNLELVPGSMGKNLDSWKLVPGSWFLGWVRIWRKLATTISTSPKCTFQCTCTPHVHIYMIVHV